MLSMTVFTINSACFFVNCVDSATLSTNSALVIPLLDSNITPEFSLPTLKPLCR